MGKALKTGLMIVVMLATILTPMANVERAESWVYQDGAPPDNLFEMFGPRADNLLIYLHPSPEAEWNGLASGQIDVTDWPLTLDYYNQFIQPPYSDNINIIPYGCEFSFYMLDINNNNNSYLGNPPNSAYPNPVYPNPCSVLGFRQAIAYLVNRTYISYDVTKGLGFPIWTPMPPSLSTFVHPEIHPGGALESLTYGGWTGDINAASELLWNSGFPIGDDGWRFWDRNFNWIYDPGEYLALKLVIQGGDTYARLVGEFIASQLEAVRIRVNIRYCDEQYAQYLVMEEKDFHLYIGRYVTGSDPTFLSNWNWRYYWHPGKPNNYDGINNPEFNNASDRVRYASYWEEAINQTWIAQEVFAQNALSVPLFSTYGVKAMSRRYVGWETPYNGNYWEGVVNIHGYGIDNYWSFLNMHPRGYNLGDGSMTIRWGLSTWAISSFNPIYASTESERKILDLIYEPLIRWNPYTFELIPWLVEGFSVDMYNHPKYGECTKVQLTMRPDAYWSDGTPVTAYDVYFTLVKLDDILASRGLPPPWWKKNVDNILDFKMLDPYNFEVLFNCVSLWLICWIPEIPILPAHIWKPIVESGDPTGSFAPDPNMIGSGPWRLKEYVANSHILLRSQQAWKHSAIKPSGKHTSNKPLWIL
jgi:ABC-type transport system substrate-binding protein